MECNDYETIYLKTRQTKQKCKNYVKNHRFCKYCRKNDVSSKQITRCKFCGIKIEGLIAPRKIPKTLSCSNRSLDCYILGGRLAHVLHLCLLRIHIPKDMRIYISRFSARELKKFYSHLKEYENFKNQSKYFIGSRHTSQ